MSVRNKRPAVESAKDKPDFLAIGKIRRPHGVTGDLLVEVLTDFPERLQPGMQLYAGDRRAPLSLIQKRQHKAGLILTFEQLKTPEQAGLFRNQNLYLKRTDQPDLPPGEYYFHELIGLQVFDETGNALGEVTGVMETGANDVYEITSKNGSEILLPAIPEVILEIDLEAGKMKVHLLPGLLEAESVSD